MTRELPPTGMSQIQVLLYFPALIFEEAATVAAMVAGLAGASVNGIATVDFGTAGPTRVTVGPSPLLSLGTVGAFIATIDHSSSAVSGKSHRLDCHRRATQRIAVNQERLGASAG